MRRFFHPSILLLPLLVAAILARATPAVAEGFVPGINDLPLMAGLESSAEEPLVFDTPEGRIVVSPVSGSVSRRQVLDFYARILPQLGWQRQNQTTFRREGEILRLEFSDGDKAGLSVRFSLSPARSSRH